MKMHCRTCRKNTEAELSVVSADIDPVEAPPLTMQLAIRIPIECTVCGVEMGEIAFTQRIPLDLKLISWHD
jgi:hypothetical protein